MANQSSFYQDANVSPQDLGNAQDFVGECAVSAALATAQANIATAQAAAAAASAASINSNSSITSARKVLAAGLATGGGDLSSDRTITVPAATSTDIDTGTSNALAVTPAGVAHALGSRSVLTAGLASGGGDLSVNRTITVPAATNADIDTGTDTTKAVTSANVAHAFAGRSILTSGLATGGGALSSNPTITVPKAVAADVTAGTDDTKAITSLALAQAGVAGINTTTTFKLGTEGTARSLSDRFQDVAVVIGYKQAIDTDDTNSFIRALATGKKVVVPYRASGYYINSQVAVPAGATIKFDTGGTTVYSSSSTCIFVLTGGYNGLSQSDSGIYGPITFDMATSNAPGSSAITFGTSINAALTPAGGVGRVVLEDLCFLNCYSAVNEDSAAATTGYIYDVALRRCRSMLTRGTQFSLQQSRGMLEIDVRVDNTANATKPSWTSVNIQNIQGLTIDRIDVVDGYGTSTPRQSSWAVIIANPTAIGGQNAAVILRGYLLVDSVVGGGVLLQNLDNWLGTGVLQVFGPLGQPLQITGCTRCQWNLSVSSNTGKGLGTAAVTLTNCYRNKGTISVDCSPGAGVYVTGATTDCLFEIECGSGTYNSVGFNNLGYGLVEDGTSARNVYRGTFRGNTGSFTLYAGSTSRVVNYFPNSGTFAAGPTSGTVA